MLAQFGLRHSKLAHVYGFHQLCFLQTLLQLWAEDQVADHNAATVIDLECSRTEHLSDSEERPGMPDSRLIYRTILPELARNRAICGILPIRFPHEYSPESSFLHRQTSLLG